MLSWDGGSSGPKQERFCFSWLQLGGLNMLRLEAARPPGQVVVVAWLPHFLFRASREMRVLRSESSRRVGR